MLNKKYNELLNYTPKSIAFEDSPNSRFKLLHKNTQNIISTALRSYQILASESIFTKEERKWFIKRIEDLATGLFLDGKIILVNKTGGYSGCPEELIYYSKLKNFDITNLMFCHGCTDGYLYDYFIKFFNRKMYALMNIKPSGIGTSLFNGEFVNKKKNSIYKTLLLNKDRTFELTKVEVDKENIYFGFWENEKFILTLDLSKYKELDDLVFEYNVNRRKITGINLKNIKFKSRN